jgi:CRP/FNR family transcriptional regulator, cyclic AMP receptor protein
MNNIFPLQSDHPLFRYLTPEERDHVESLAREVRIDEGGFLIRERERDSTLFTVEDGRLEIVVYNEGDAKTIATVGPGDVLGEVSFIDDSARTVSVRAAEDTRVFAWERDHLSAELAKNPELLAKFSIAMCELLVERLRDSVRRM